MAWVITVIAIPTRVIDVSMLAVFGIGRSRRRTIVAVCTFLFLSPGARRTSLTSLFFDLISYSVDDSSTLSTVFIHFGAMPVKSLRQRSRVLDRFLSVHAKARQ